MEQKQPPIFYYNENADRDPDFKTHFFATQIQNIFLAIFITALMQFSNHLALYLVYCCPIYFLLIVIQYFAFWKPKRDLTKLFNILNLVLFIICVPIFFGVFFAVFHPTASVEFKKVQNCQMIGQISNWIEQIEKYSILYINFEYEGQTYLGYGCSSDYYQEKTASSILPYKFYYKYDTMTCGSSDGNKTSPQIIRLLEQNQFNQTKVDYNERGRILSSSRSRRSTNRRSSRTSSVSRSSSSSSSSSSSNFNYTYYFQKGSCYTQYVWSNVKIASWLCQDRDFDVEDFMEPQPCYVNFFTGDTAKQNGLIRPFLREQYNFPLISYEPHAYYPEADLVCLIIFSYYTWILSLNSLLQYTSNFFLKKYRMYKKKIFIPQLEQKNTTDSLQGGQISKYVLTQQPIPNKVNRLNQNQINQPVISQIDPNMNLINQQNINTITQPSYNQMYSPNINLLNQHQLTPNINNQTYLVPQPQQITQSYSPNIEYQQQYYLTPNQIPVQAQIINRVPVQQEMQNLDNADQAPLKLDL